MTPHTRVGVTRYLLDVTRAQAERICARLVPKAPALTTGQLGARLLREVQAIDPDYTRRTCEKAVQARGVHGYLDHTGTTALTGSGLPALKDARGWTLHQPRPGHFTWTSPLGRTYDTRGDPVTPDLPDPLPRESEPHRPGLPLVWEGPILRIPEKHPPPRPPPVRLPDEPPF